MVPLWRCTDDLSAEEVWRPRWHHSWEAGGQTDACGACTRRKRWRSANLEGNSPPINRCCRRSERRITSISDGASAGAAPRGASPGPVRLSKTLDHVQRCRLDEIGRVRVERKAFR
jgi:hypothetical protein